MRSLFHRLVAATVGGASLIGLSASATPAQQVGSPTECWSRATVGAWDPLTRAGNVLVVGIPIKESDRAARLVAEHHLGGILVRGVPNRTDTAERLATIRRAGGAIPVMLAVDEEGGRVQHLRAAVGRLPSASAMSKLDPGTVTALARTHGKGMRALGFTANLGPILDLGGNRGSGIGDRGFSPDPVQAATYGHAFASGLLEAGIFPIVKHFPGHGRANGDSHSIGPVTPPLDELGRRDLVPFRALTESLPIGVMTGHLWVPGTRDLPASLNPELINGMLRRDWGFDGLVVTDSLSMWAIRSSLSRARAAEYALRAGNDVMLFDDEPDIGRVAAALADLAATDAVLNELLITANLRFLRAKRANVCPGATSTGDSSTTSTTPPTTAPTRTTPTPSTPSTPSTTTAPTPTPTPTPTTAAPTPPSTDLPSTTPTATTPTATTPTATTPTATTPAATTPAPTATTPTTTTA